MKKLFLMITLLWLSYSQAALAQPANIKAMADENIGATTVTIKYANVRAAKKFKFQLYDRRAGRTDYRKVDTFFIKRTSKKKTNATSTISGLNTTRDYRIRYKPIYYGDREGVWSDYLHFTTKEKGIYITLDAGDSLLADDLPSIYVDSASQTTATPGIYSLTQQTDGTWLGIIPDVTPGDVVQYLFARNYAGARSFEQFTPDNVSERRSLTVDTIPFNKSITVEAWRWLVDIPTDGTVSTEAYPVVARDPFIIGAAVFNGQMSNFPNFSSPTFTSMAELNLPYVILPFATRMITDGQTADTTENVTDYLTENQYTEQLAVAEQAGLTPIMKIDLPLDPDNAETIRAQLNDSTEREFFGTYLTRWREAMKDGIDYAMDHNIGVVVLDTSFYDTLNLANDDEQYYFNTVLRDDILELVAANYTGILTTAQLSVDPDFDWYQSSYIDWLGASWYPTSAADLTAIYQPLSTQYGKPVFFYQLGIYSIDGIASLGSSLAPDDAAVDPDQTDDTYTVDFQEQADLTETIFRAIADQAFVVGAIAPNYSYGVQYDKSANIRGKTARLVWQRWAQLFNN